MPRGYKNDAAKEKAIAYVHGRTEAQLEHYARALNIPSEELAKRIGQLLAGQHTVSNVNASALPDLSPGGSGLDHELRQVAMDRGTHSRRAPGSQSAANKQSYWGKMTPEQRKAEVKRRAAVSNKNKRRRTREEKKNGINNQ